MSFFNKMLEGDNFSDSKLYEKTMEIKHKELENSKLDCPIVNDSFGDYKTIIVDFDFDLCKDFSEDYIKKGYSYISFKDAITEFEKSNIESPDIDWANLQIYEKYEIISSLVSFISEKIELKSIPGIRIYPDENKSNYGRYDWKSNVILLNDVCLDSPQQTFETIAHELWHAHQHECATDPKSFRHLLYQYNFSNYIGPYYDYDLYRSQLVEVEARAFATEMTNSVKNAIERW